MRLDFKEERDMDFLSSYKSVIKAHGNNAPYLKKEYLLQQALLHPARRFYVSEEQSFRVINSMLKGIDTHIKNPLKLTMYNEILLRVQEEMKISDKSTSEIIQLIINREAPRFYLTLESAQILYYKLIRKRK